MKTELKIAEENMKLRKGCVTPRDTDYVFGKIETDKVKLNQIFSKLIRNAIKFTSKGVISFGYELRKNNELIFFTKDTGIGI